MTLDTTFLNIVVKNASSTVRIQSNLATSILSVAQGPQGKLGPVGPVGPQGPQGVPGAGNSFPGICGGQISSGCVVVLSDGLLYRADPTNLAHAPLVAGISSQSGNIGDTITVISAGDLDGESLTQGSRYYVGLNGSLSTTPIAVGAMWVQAVGIAQTNSMLLVKLNPSVTLA